MLGWQWGSEVMRRVISQAWWGSWRPQNMGVSAGVGDEGGFQWDDRVEGAMSGSWVWGAAGKGEQRQLGVGGGAGGGNGKW